jgi:cysteine-rich repeat protein
VVVTCVDGVTDDGAGEYEQCDDENDVNTDECTNNCIDAACGDGIVQVVLGEECDDGNTDPTDTCTNACLDADCNDGIRQAGEECDAGTAVASEIPGVDNDDSYDDTSGFCSNTCQVQCFPSPARAWAKESADDTCVFVPEPVGDNTGGVYDDLDFLSGNLGFMAAEAYCGGLGINAHLVKIDSEEKNDFVYDLVTASLAADIATSDTAYCLAFTQDAIPCPAASNDGGDPDACCIEVANAPYWIGLYDVHTTQIDPPGLWTWIGDESAVSGNGGNGLWMSGFPNDLDGDTGTPGQADCGGMIGSDSSGTPGEWNDLVCNATYRFVCEFPLDQSP